MSVYKLPKNLGEIRTEYSPEEPFVIYPECRWAAYYFINGEYKLWASGSTEAEAIGHVVMVMFHKENNNG